MTALDDPSHPLATAILKVEWALEHLNKLHDEVEAFLNTKPYSTSHEFNRQTGDYFVSVHVREDPPPRMRLLVSEVLFNLKSALDCVIYSLAVQATGQDPPPKSHALEFPIFKDPDEFEAKKRSRGAKLEGLSPPMRAEIKGLQPFEPWQQFTIPLLWSLHELHRRDKHRKLVLLGGTWGREPIVLGKATPEGVVPRIHTILAGPFEEGAHLFEITIDPVPDGEVKVEVGMSFGVTVNEPDAVPPGPYRIDEILESMATAVATIIYDLAEKFIDPPSA